MEYFKNIQMAIEFVEKKLDQKTKRIEQKVLQNFLEQFSSVVLSTSITISLLGVKFFTKSCDQIN